MSAFNKAWSVVKEEAPIEPFDMDMTGNGFRSSKEVQQVHDLHLKDGTIIPTAYMVFHGISGTITYFSPEAMGRVKKPKDLWDGDLTHLVSQHICEGCGDQLDSKTEQEFEEGFVDEQCRDCRGLSVECPECGEDRPGLDIPCPECDSGGAYDDSQWEAGY
tara:strand:- start:461 stop:943 length:483 start_codon:yes stop_codon:yes gene_type:complete